MNAVQNKPEMTLLASGKSIKTFKITATAGMEMPEHHSTKEAVVVVQKGKAILTMPDKKHVLETGSSFIIPAGVNHSLSIQEDFQALAIMALESEIKFK